VNDQNRNPQHNGQRQNGQQKQQQKHNQQQKQQNGQQGSSKSRRRRSQKQKLPADLWRPVPQLPDPAPIVPAADPTGLIRSLGDPPLQGHATVGGHYLIAVVERAAGLATALAAAAGLLTDPEPDLDLEGDPHANRPGTRVRPLVGGR
jgi:hypothetical protein